MGVRLTGLDHGAAPERPARAWLSESTGWLALLATRETYDAQPQLWELGEYGRARTIEDFTHHLRAAIDGGRAWRAHLQYCVTLFSQRGFPGRWLTDAFVTLDEVLERELPADVTEGVRAVLRTGEPLLRVLAEEAGVDLDLPTRYDA